MSTQDLTSGDVASYHGGRMLAATISELDLLNLARSSDQAITSDFAQVVTITFAMVVAIYYFLHQAGIRMKIFAFAIYSCGMWTYFSLMLLESGMALGTLTALRAIPPAEQSLPTQYFLRLHSSWVGMMASTSLNLIYWFLWLGIGYLLFFWRKPGEPARPQD